MENQLEMTSSVSCGLNSISKEKQVSSTRAIYAKHIMKTVCKRSQKQESDRLKQMLIND